MRVVLISTYELGRQPFGLASPAAWLRAAGHDVECLDLSVQRLDESLVAGADLVAFYLPMHTATRIAMPALDRVRAVNAEAELCAYGLYAPVNAGLLRQRGVGAILGGEFEAGLVSLADRLQARGRRGAARAEPEAQLEPEISLERLEFRPPDREGLAPLADYAHLTTPAGERRTVGYTEASRGCRHLCRHCPVVPVYNGQFRVVPVEVVLHDIARQVELGAEHVTFGDPDFFNGPKHALAVVRGLHERFPELSYDVTIKVEHLLRHRAHLGVLAETGCAFVTTAVESLDDRVLEILDKGHTRDDFFEVVEVCAAAAVPLQPTFVAFTPWITLAGYEDLLATLARLGLIDNVPSIQLAIRLLIPAASRLLELAEVRELVEPFDPNMLGHPWRHADARVDALQRDIEALIEKAGDDADRRELFADAWELLQQARGASVSAAGEPSLPPLPPVPPGRPRARIPYLSEPWYC